MIRARVMAFALLMTTAIGGPILGVGTPFGADEPGVFHRYLMRGRLLDVEGEAIYMCVGTRQGAEVGQRLDIFRYRRDTSRNPKQSVHMKRIRVGALEIRELVDVHFARAVVVEGSPRAGDVAELERPREGG